MSQYFCGKPTAVSAEFSEMATKIMDEEDWLKPEDAVGGLDLYTKLVDAVEAGQ